MQTNKLLTKLSSRQGIVELFLSGAVMAIVAVRPISAAADPLPMAFMLFLAVFYFMSAYSPLTAPVPGIFSIITSKVLHVSSSVCMVGLVLAGLGLKGAPNMLLVGASSITIAAFLFAVTTFRAWIALYWLWVLRAAVLGAVSLITLLPLLERN